MLTAGGKSPREIAKLLGCHEKTVSNMKREPWWTPELERWTEAGLAKLDDAITAQRARMLVIHDEFADGIREAMQAELPSGDPNWPVRLQAYKLVAEHTSIKALLGSGYESEDKAPGQVTVVQFHIPADKMPRQVGDAEVVIDQTPKELEAGDA